MKTASKMPVALTIAGSDSGGGAGIQADLKTFAALGVHGASAITCLTAQNPARVSGIEAASPRMVRLQIEAVLTGLPPAAIKTGMLYSAEIIRTVARLFRSPGRPPLVVDPVMVSTSGARLLQPAAIRELTGRLFPLATLLTPNLDEAAVLLGRKPGTLEAMRAAARELHARFGCAILMKGGHLRGQREAADIFYDGRTELLLLAPFIRGLHLHGTGCTYSAAIAGYLAGGSELPAAVTRGKEFITRAIAGSRSIGKHTALVPS